MESSQTCIVCIYTKAEETREASIVCESCYKQMYCCEEHRKTDWVRHKEDCYPARIEKDDHFGRFMVATRDIKQGELIFHENPLMTGPASTSAFMPLCLSCYKQVKTSYTCTVCKWSVCGPECEKLPQHAEYECKVLAKSNVPPAKRPAQYICINALRCLLLKEAASDRWEKILNLESHSVSRLKSQNSMCIFGLVWSFLDERCNISGFDVNTIRQVLGAIEVNIHHFSDSEEDTGFIRQGRHI